MVDLPVPYLLANTFEISGRATGMISQPQDSNTGDKAFHVISIMRKLLDQGDDASPDLHVRNPRERAYQREPIGARQKV